MHVFMGDSLLVKNTWSLCTGLRLQINDYLLDAPRIVQLHYIKLKQNGDENNNISSSRILA